MRKVLRKVNQKIDRWLHKEEYEAMEQEQQKQMELVEKLKEDLERVKEQVQIIEQEDHSQPPTDDDVDRYYDYHRTYVENIRTMKEKTGMWVTKEKPLIPRIEFRQKAEQEGWSFLRGSCGLPEGSILERGAPWASWMDDGQKWQTEETQEVQDQ